MTRIAYLACIILGISACSDDTGGDDGGGAGGSGGAIASGGNSTGGSNSGAGGSEPSGTGGRPSNPNECLLQGEYTAGAEATMPELMCNAFPSFRTVYHITIEGTIITFTQRVEQYPMSGTIDAQCKASVVLSGPLYREFQVTLDPASLTATGTYVEGDLSDCRSTYNVSMTLTAGHL